jgi:hypothetical protein
MTIPAKFVIPANAGIQMPLSETKMDSRWSLPSSALIGGGNDENGSYTMLDSSARAFGKLGGRL